MKKFNRLKLTKKTPSVNHKYATSSQSEYDHFMKLKAKGYHVTVIKSIELSISQYFKRIGQAVTIHSFEIDGLNVNISVCKNDKVQTIVVPKVELQTGKSIYEFLIGCEEVKVVERDYEYRFKVHKEKENVIYLEI